MDKRKKFMIRIIAGMLCICLIAASLFVEFYGFPLFAAQEHTEALALTPSEGEETEEPIEESEIYQEKLDFLEETEESGTGESSLLGETEESETGESDSLDETWNPDMVLPYESPGEASAKRHKIKSIEDVEIVEETLRSAAPSCGIISTDTTWTAGTLRDGELVINEGVTLTINGQIIISGTVTIKGGGTIARGSKDANIRTSSSSVLTIGNVTIDGKYLSSQTSMIYSDSSNVILDDGCVIQNCVKTTKEAAGLHSQKGTVICNDVTFQNCRGCGWGGAISIRNSTMTINGGLYQNNTDAGFAVGSAVYSIASKLYINGGRFIGNISNGQSIGACITDISAYGNETYLYGGYFEGNKSISSELKGAGAVCFSANILNDSYNKNSVFCISGDVRFCTDGVEDSGVDGFFLDFKNFEQKIQIGSPLKSPIYIYLNAKEGYVIAKGANNGYILQEKDMNQIHFTDIGTSGKKWYAWLNQETNEIYLSEDVPPYGYYIYYSGNGAKGEVTDDKEYEDGEEAVIKSEESFMYDGYAFDGWNTKPDGSGASYEPGNKVNMTDSLTLYAQWIKEEEKTLKADFYSGAAGHVERIETKAEDPVITMPSLEEMDGWTAIGWNESASDYAGNILENTEHTLTKNISYYGVYQKDVTLSYNVNGGSNAPENETKTCYANVHDEITYTYGVDTQFIVGHEAVPGIEDAVFMGWNDKEDGTGTLYKEGDALTLTEDTTLYAVYEVPPFATFYFGTGGNYIKRGVNLLTGNRTIEVPGREEMEVLDMEDWTALGFNRETDNCVYGENTLHEGTTLTLGDEYLTFYGIYEKDVTLTYAYDNPLYGKDVIEEHTQTCYANVHNKIIYQNSEDFSNIYEGVPFIVALGEDDLNIPEGYRFLGWSADPENGERLYEEDDKITIQDDTTLYAQWTLMDFEVNFDLNGGKGETPKEQIVSYGNLLQPVADPAKKGYRFLGWYKDAEGTEGSRWDFGKTVEQNTSEYKITLYAKYLDDIAPILGNVSYNEGYKDVLNWIVRKKNLVLTVPITEEGSGVKEASYTLMPDEATENIMTAGRGRSSGVTGLADITEENGQTVAKITIDEDFKGKISMICFDNAENISPSKYITSSASGIIVEDNAPEIRFASLEGELYDSHMKQASIRVEVQDSGEKSRGNKRVTGGISKISYWIDSEEDTDIYEELLKDSMVEEFYFIVNITGEGNHILSVTAIDNAGNETTSQITVDVVEKHEYKVEYYKQDIIGDGYTKADSETEYLTGTTGSTVTAEIKRFTGFTENISHDARMESGIVTEDDSLVLKLYYDRDTYEVAFDLNGMEGETPETQIVRYGGFLEKVEDPAKKGYSFRGWYTEKEETKGREWDFDETVENNTAFHTVTLYAMYEDDIAPVFGKTSYNSGYKNIKNWIIRKKELILSVPIIEDGSGIEHAEYILEPEGEEYTAQITNDNAAEIIIGEDFKGNVLLRCDDRAGNHSMEKTVTITGGGIIVEDNAPKISFSAKKGKLSDWFLDEAEIKVMVEDGKNETITGGIAGISYQIDGGKTKTVDSKNFDERIVDTCDFTVNISGAAEHTLTVTALDNAGNKSISKITVKIKSEAYIADTITYDSNDLPKSGEPKSREPKTGDSMQMELFATIAMLAFFSYILLCFSAGNYGWKEERIRNQITQLIRWKKRGRGCRKIAANTVIFFLMLYYYSVGRLATVSWKRVYER